MNAHPSWPSQREPRFDGPLCVDLDGTLLATDVLFETFVRYIKRNPLRVLNVARWVLRGPAYLKAKLTEAVELDPALLPANADFVEWLRAEKQTGRKLVLCTAANDVAARRIADHFGLFDEVMASSAVDNLSGRLKAQHLVARYGAKGFDYAANERKDMHVWRQARSAVIVAPRSLIHEVSAHSITVERSFEVDGGGVRARAGRWLRALRLHQWTKNLLVFVPLAAAHRVDDLAALGAAVLAFVLFGMCASGGYIVNDLLDLDADRVHVRKRSRPFAAGHLSIRSGLFAAAGLIGLAVVVAVLALPWLFALTLVAYLGTSLWYSLALKRVAMVDVLCLAALYSVRIVAGGAAVAIVPSFWLLAFSMFLFLSLAAAKRFAELNLVRDAGRQDAPGRGYSIGDLPLLQSSGIGSGYVCVLVLALYVNSGAAGLYAHPQAMWLLCPLLLYWINRVWLKTSRGQMHDDPVVFAATDHPSWMVFALSAVLVVVAS